MEKKILYLYSELMPYVIPVLREFVSKGYKVYVIKGDSKLQTPYQPPIENDIIYFNRSEFKTVNQLYSFVKQINPSLIYICGSIDRLYYLTTKKVRKELNIPIISGLDSQWRGGLQWGNVLFSKYRHRTWFSHILVAGVRSFEYAKRLGFKNNQIISPNYSADMNLFGNIDITHKKNKYPHNLLFVGRLSEEKGLLLLLQAWNNIKDKGDWRLTIIGSGILKKEVEKYNNVKLIDFIPQNEIIKEMQKSGCFILPSIFEPWALVIHEAAAAGLPIAATSSCGATDCFLINGYNGFSFESNKVLEIEAVINKIIYTSDEELYRMGERSKELAKKIRPQYVADVMLGTIF